MPRGQKGEFDAKSRLNGASAVGSTRCRRTGQKRETARQKVRLTPDGMQEPRGGPCGYFYVSKDSPFHQQSGRELRPEKEMSDG